MSLYQQAFLRGIKQVFTLPRLSLPLILTLGLTLAAVLAVSSIANTLLFQPLPDIHEEENLHTVDLSIDFSEGLTPRFLGTLRRTASLKAASHDSLQWGVLLRSGAEIHVNGTYYPVMSFNGSSGLIELFGLPLIKGKPSSVDGSEQGVWISEDLWKGAFHGRDDILEQTLRLDGQDLPIWGVVSTFYSLETDQKDESFGQQIWRFETFESALKEAESLKMSMQSLTVVRGNAELIPTKDEIDNWYLNYIDTELPNPRVKELILSKAYHITVDAYRNGYVGDSYKLVMLLLTTMISLLVMATLNLLNMYIAYYQSRAKEFSVQLCMGSSAARLRRLLFVENTPLFLLALVLGLLSALWLVELLPSYAGDHISMLEQIQIDPLSVLFALLIVVLINIIFAFVALISINKSALSDHLNSSGKGTPAQQKKGLNQALMLIQIVLACLLLSASMTSVKQSYQEVYQPLGYSMKNAYEIDINFIDKAWHQALARYDSADYLGSEFRALRQKFVDRLESLGGTVIDTPYLPLTSSLIVNMFDDKATNESYMVKVKTWAEGYFEAFDIEVLAGRNFTQADVDTNKVLVSRRLAEAKYGKHQWRDIVNSELDLGNNTPKIHTVIGVVEETTDLVGGHFDNNLPSIYYSEHTLDQKLSAVVVMPPMESLTLEQVSEALDGLDARFGAVGVTKMQDRWEDMVSASRINMMVVSVLALLTLGLAVIGISGLSQMTAAQKRYELAVRQATGAMQRGLLALLLKDAAWVLFFGLSLGFIAATTGYSYLASIFEGAPQFDWTLMLVSCVVLSIAMLCSFALPGWRVVRDDPMKALRAL